MTMETMARITEIMGMTAMMIKAIKAITIANA